MEQDGLVRLRGLIDRKDELTKKIRDDESSIMTTKERIQASRAGLEQIDRQIDRQIADLLQPEPMQAKQNASPVSSIGSNIVVSSTAGPARSSPLPRPILARVTAPAKQEIAPRPGLRRCEGPPRSPDKYIMEKDYEKEKKHRENRLMLHDKLPMVVQLDNVWTEIWCHVCGANASGPGAREGMAFRGVAGLHSHVKSTHGVAGNPLNIRDLLKICGRHELTREEVRDLRRWRVTVNLRQPPRSDTVRPRRSFAERAANDIDDANIISIDDENEDDEATEPSGYQGHILTRPDRPRYGLHNAFVPINPAYKVTPVRNPAASNDGDWSPRSTPGKRAAERDTSSPVRDSANHGVAERAKKRRVEAEQPRWKYTDAVEYRDGEAS